MLEPPRRCVPQSLHPHPRQARPWKPPTRHQWSPSSLGCQADEFGCDVVRLAVLPAGARSRWISEPHPGTFTSDAFSADGRRLAFISGRRSDLYVALADGSHRRRIVQRAGSGSVAWSPGGTQVTFEHHGAVETVDQLGHNRRTVFAAEPGIPRQSLIGWSIRGDVAANGYTSTSPVAGTDGLVVRIRNGLTGPVRELALPNATGFTCSDWTADGARLICSWATHTGARSSSVAGLVDPTTGEVTRRFPSAGCGRHAVASPDGRLVAAGVTRLRLCTSAGRFIRHISVPSPAAWTRQGWAPLIASGWQPLR